MISGKRYVERVWLNPDMSDLTGSIVCFDGIVTDFEGKNYPETFGEIADCHRKVRIHKTSDSTNEEFLFKLRSLRNEITKFITHLENKEVEP